MVLVKDTIGYPNGQDLLYTPESLAGLPGVGEEGDSNVYDFTKPCPDFCDPESPLFSDQPPAKK